MSIPARPAVGDPLHHSFLCAAGFPSHEHPGLRMRSPPSPASLSITFNTLTVTVYNVSILQNRSVNSSLQSSN